MKNKLIPVAAGLSLLLGGVSTASAALIDRGNGMIYDSDQDLTWLQDANYAKTSGYDAIGMDWAGRMDWATATSWAAGLSYGGYDDWRLPTITDDNNNGCAKDDGTYVWYNGSDCSYNVDTSDSELAYMWYDILGNTPYYDTRGNSSQSGWGLTSTSADGVDILNLRSFYYWSGTEYAPVTNVAWYFDTYDGEQNGGDKRNVFYAWAVRSGDVATVPEPGTLLLLGAGVTGMMFSRRRRCKLKASSET